MTDRKAYKHFEGIYKGNPDQIPWNSVRPPELLVKLVESGKVKAGRALDLGCGLGNYVIWLAKKGFDAVGLDASPTAVRIAKQKAKKKKAKCRFMVADLTGRWPNLGKRFDFVYDWGLLHHIPPDKRLRYVKNVHRVLKPGGSTSSPQGGKYVSVCFNVKDTAFEGKGKVRNTHLGTAVYLSSKPELRRLFGRFFRIIDFRVLKIQGKIMSHVFNYCLMERKGS